MATSLSGATTVVSSGGFVTLSGASSGGQFGAIAVVNQAPVLRPVTNGTVTTDFGSWNADARSVVIQPDGKMVVAGYAQSPSGYVSELVRYNADGSIDTTFGTGGVVSSGPGFATGSGVVLQNDGKIVTSGAVFGSPNHFALARYNSDGSVDTTFGTGGKVVTDFGNTVSYSMMIQPDGKIVLTGSAGNDFAVARFNVDGSFDTSFGVGGKVTTDLGGTYAAGYDVAGTPDGKIVVAGIHDVSGVYDFAVVRYNNDGSLDASFGVGGRVTTDFASSSDIPYSVTVQADGKIIVSGVSNGNFGLVRYNVDGSLDASFGTGGKVVTDFGSFLELGNSVIVQADGKIVVAGFAHPDLQNDFALARYNSDGSLDTSFGTGGRVITGIGYDLGVAVSVIDPADGTIVLVGRSDAGDYALARYNSNGSLDVLFGVATASYEENASAVRVAPKSIFVTDDNVSFDGGSLTAALTAGSHAGDNLTLISSVTPGTGIELSGSTVKYNSVIIGTLSGSGTATLTVALNGSAWAAAIEAVAGAVGFASTSDDPGTDGRTVTFTLVDGAGTANGGHDTGSLTQAVRVAPVNDAPTLGGDLGIALRPGGTMTVTTADLTATDPDNANAQLVYTITGTSHGQVLLNGSALSNGQTFTQADLAANRVSYRHDGSATSTGGFQVSLTDGVATPQTAIVNADVGNHAPQVSLPAGANVPATQAQTLQVSSLFSGSDAEGDTLTYYLYDSNGAANSGHFVVGGTTVPAQTIYALTAAQLAQATFVAGAAGTSDSILVQAFDGIAYSGWNASVNVAVPANHAPIVSLPAGSNVSATVAQTLQVSSLFSGSDADGDALTYYLYDSNSAANSGHFVVNGVTVPAQTIYALTAAQFTQATFVAGAAGIADDILVQAFDGKAYSGWNSSVHVAASVNHAPTINALQANVSATATQSITFANLFMPSDSDNDPLTFYVYDSNAAANSGHLVVNGVTVPAQTIYALTTAQFLQTTFVTGAAGISDDIYVQAFDGEAYSGWNASVHFTSVAPVNHAPFVNRPASPYVKASPAESLAVSSLFSGSDADNDALTYYLYDSNAAVNSGHFVVNGVTVPAQSIYALTAAELAAATYVAGAAGTSDELLVQAFDGKDYSGWTTSVQVSVNRAPVVTVVQASVTASTTQQLTVPNLFSISDGDNDLLTYYLYDSNSAANSGHFVINGVAVPALTIHALTAVEFAQAIFVAGAAGTSDSVYAQAFDGKAYSGWNASVDVAVPVSNNAPTVSLPSGANVTASAAVEVFQLSDLFSGSDLDGDTLTYYLYDANSSSNSGRFMVDGSYVPAETVFQVNATQLAQATFVAGSTASADDIFVQAYDGKAYSGWNTSVHVEVAGVSHAPVVDLLQGNSVQAYAAQSILVSSLFAVNDVDGGTQKYYFYDANPAPDSGHFVVDGNAVAAQTIIPLTAAQFAQATFVAGAAGTSDDIFVQAFDGQLYSGWNTSVDIFV